MLLEVQLSHITSGLHTSVHSPWYYRSYKIDKNRVRVAST